MVLCQTDATIWVTDFTKKCQRVFFYLFIFIEFIDTRGALTGRWDVPYVSELAKHQKVLTASSSPPGVFGATLVKRCGASQAEDHRSLVNVPDWPSLQMRSPSTVQDEREILVLICKMFPLDCVLFRHLGSSEPNR